MLFPFFMNVLHAPARLVLGFYLLADNLLPFLISSGTGGTGVAYGAHIGGFLGGLVLAIATNRRSLRSHSAEAGANVGHPSPDSLAALIEDGDYEAENTNAKIAVMPWGGSKGEAVELERVEKGK